MNTRHIESAWLISHGWSYLADEEMPWQKKWKADDDQSLGLHNSKASTSSIAVSVEMRQELGLDR